MRACVRVMCGCVHMCERYIAFKTINRYEFNICINSCKQLLSLGIAFSTLLNVIPLKTQISLRIHKV